MAPDPDYNWRRDALCYGKLADLWFPPNDKTNRLSYSDIGVMICEQCPVWEQCLEDGLEELWGVWGGLTPKERSVLVLGGGQFAQHGSVVRYRQGCRCSECYEAETEPKLPININAIPCHGEPLPKPEELLQKVLMFGW